MNETFWVPAWWAPYGSSDFTEAQERAQKRATRYGKPMHVFFNMSKSNYSYSEKPPEGGDDDPHDESSSLVCLKLVAIMQPNWSRVPFTKLPEVGRGRWFLDQYSDEKYERWKKKILKAHPKAKFRHREKYMIMAGSKFYLHCAVARCRPDL